MSVGKETWGRLSPLLDELLDLPDDARAARLADLRAQDPALADAVGAMLGHLPAIERGEFMPESALPKPAGLDGQTVGPYTLVREIGHGGMGTVWLARRTDGRYEGEVAIKFLRTGLFGHGDAERFEREGSILARLSHPHIARLLDAGVAADGAQPYLVLEYIDGEPIDEYCQRVALSVPARLALMLDVLAAVAQAHNRLVLHRDLKPTNILVTKSGDVKLLDFGIAKLLDDAGAGAQTALTARAGNAFTPEFAAPEQLQGGDVTTATDVYALGVLMYILLGGEHPTAGATGAPLERMRSVIETVPKRLSDAALRRGGPSARFSPESRKLAGELKGDIETIVAKALKKAPAERYANAAALADDVRRYLAHEPIAARPDARLYRLGKFVRRHRAGVAMATATVAALGVGIGVALWQAREARAQRVQAEGLIEYMIGDLRKKLQPVGRLDVLDGVGAKALAYYAAQNLDHLDADSLGRRARALHMIGDLAVKQGKLQVAQQDFAQAAATTNELLQRDPNDGQRIFDQSQSEFYVGYIAWQRGDLRGALTSFRRYDTMARRMVLVQPDNHDWLLEKAFAAQNMAIVLLDIGQPDEAQALFNEARAEIATLVKTHPEDTFSNANAIGWSALAQAALGHYDLAIADENAKIAAAMRAPDSDKNRDLKYLIGDGHLEIALFLRDLGRLDESLQMVRTSIAELTRLNVLDPSDTDDQGELLRARMTAADLQVDGGNLAGARAELATAQGLLDHLLKRPVPKRGWWLPGRGRAVALQARLAASPAEAAAAQAALTAWLADVAKYEQQGNEVPVETVLIVADAGLALGDTLSKTGQVEAARAAWQAAAARLHPQANQLIPAAMTLLGLTDLRLGGAHDAQAWATRVMGTSYRHPAFADLQKQLGQAQKSGATPTS